MAIEDLDLYQEELLEHYKNQEHRGTIYDASFSSGEYNPSCGDEIKIEGIVHNNIITEIKFIGKGCLISQAATSMLIEYALNKSISEMLAWNKDTILSLIKIKLGPTRLRCALLGLYALQGGLRNYLEQQHKN